MSNRLKQIKSREKGAVEIVEASFVFPVTFIILFFLIFIGNAFFEKAQVESIITSEAISGAALCSDPLLETVRRTGSVPCVEDLKTDPYRYVFGGMGEVEEKIEKEVRNRVESETKLLFSNMKPKIRNLTVEYRNKYLVYPSFVVELEYSMSFPIRFLGKSSPEVLCIATRAEIPVNDSPEFIRNTDMVIDLFPDSLKSKISNIFGKINDFISNFAGKK